ncbi:GNAT family N-acetyltransferase [Microbacterium saperdae]|uniref:[SSU ribosomal protein S5P]-alanine acetyltransferase n=1 Tax=Microbacterium saperdae TaxID=69368 RepID=A0A543BMR7_9MICO|nr:GNAT family protein [Microbacterium saperdae]TQL86125.1 [SSU ribosomal protein S5P]-alanine acetyltransferase [Microbacterium saperdae]GGM50419.1 ribosomal-protein-alanine acetyltransferase [Microbacterium saperdae]
MHRLDADHTLRPVETGDGAALARAYLRNRAHLAPWEPVRDVDFFSETWQERDVIQYVSDAPAGRNVRFVIVSSDGSIRGRVNLNNIVRGAFRSADLGYWVDAALQGRGLATRSVEIALGHAREELGLHRVQAATLVQNAASQRVLGANGFERIGLAPRYLRIAGSWQDHVLFQRLLEEPVSALPAHP